MKKNILLVLVTAIICVGVTAFAYSYNAGDIGYKSTNVESALDELYTKADKEILRELTLKMRTFSFSSQYDSQTNYMLFDTKLSQFYSYFMITNISCNSNSKNYATYGYNTTTSSSDILTTNTEYSFNTYNNVWTILGSNTNGQDAHCDVYVKFYNK